MISFTLLTKKLKRMELKDLKWFLLLTFFEPFMYFMGESFGMKHVSATVGSVIIATIPLFTPIAAWYFNKEKLSVLNFFGILISILGVFMVIYNVQSGLNASIKGIAILMVAVAAAAGYSVSLKKLAHKYNPLSIITYQNFFGIFFFAPFFFTFEYDHFKNAVISTEVLIALIELAVFGSTLAFIFYTYAIKQIGINKANSFINLIPVFTAIFAYFVRGEILTSQKMIGITIVISGLFLTQISRFSKKAPKTITSNVTGSNL